MLKNISKNLNKKEYISVSLNDTDSVAKLFAKNLIGGEVVVLTGELGSGKTTFVKSIADYFGVRTVVNSPTFVIMKEYETKSIFPKYIIHIDCYRLKNTSDASALDLQDYIKNKNYITFIEWGEKIQKILPRNTIYINFEHVKENERKIIFQEEL